MAVTDIFDHNSPALNQQPRPYRLTVVMMVKNEAQNLAITLPALQGWIDELIVLDSGSTDQSQQLVEQAGGQWQVSADWQGFGVQRQRAQAYATGDWILALDADEEITPKLRDSILQAIQQPPANMVYGMKRVDCIFGHKIDNPYWPLKAHWRLYPNTFQYNANTVHESVELGDAQTVALTGYALHHTAATPLFWLDKRLAYAKTWAAERHAKGKTTSIGGVLGHAIWAFFKQYLLDGRFLMGRYGLVYVLLFVQYTFNKYAILYDLNQNLVQEPPRNPNPQPIEQTTPDAQCSLSLVMIVKNEAKHLSACLESVRDIVDELIVLDSGSTDETQAIAEAYGATWQVNTDWHGFGRQRQLAQYYATGDYVLVLDADEQVDATLKQSIQQVLQQPLQTDLVFMLARVNYFCGVPTHLRGWYRDWQKRLYARDSFQYSSLDVHETLESQTAELVKLKGIQHHHTSDDLYHYLVKRLRYSQDWADEKHQNGKTVSLAGVLLHGWFSFIREYWIRGGFLYLRYGTLSSVVLMWYTLNKYLILWQYKQRAS